MKNIKLFLTEALNENATYVSTLNAIYQYFMDDDTMDEDIFSDMVEEPSFDEFKKILKSNGNDKCTFNITPEEGGTAGDSFININVADKHITISVVCDDDPEEGMVVKDFLKKIKAKKA